MGVTAVRATGGDVPENAAHQTFAAPVTIGD